MNESYHSSLLIQLIINFSNNKKIIKILEQVLKDKTLICIFSDIYYRNLSSIKKLSLILEPYGSFM